AEFLCTRPMSFLFSVLTDKKSIFQGETIEIRGIVSSQTQQSPVTLQVLNPKNAVYRSDTVYPGLFFSYSYSLIVGGPVGIPGEYTIHATNNGQKQSTTFQVLASTKGRILHGYFMTVDIVGLTKAGSVADQIRKIEALNLC